jgi:aminocarboxymuconate-semialdehyde decarboxylase
LSSAPELRIDLHTHILPERWPDLRERYGYGGFVSLEHHAPCRARMIIDGRPFREITDSSWDPVRRLEDCDRDGVRVQVLSTVPVMFSYWARPADAWDLSRLLNDHIASVVADYPSRFIGLGTLPLQDAGLAVRELERGVRELGFPGAQIGTHVNQSNLDDPAFFPVYEAAESLNAALFVHPWDMVGRERMPRYWLPWLVGMPAEQSRAACCLVFGGVLERLPGLKVCMAHGGGAFPYTIGRIEHGFNMRPDLVATDNPRNPREYLDRLYFDSWVADPRALRYLLETCGVSQVMLGTDYPFPLGEQSPGAGIASLELPADEQARLYHGTALEWLGLPKSRFA